MSLSRRHFSKFVGGAILADVRLSTLASVGKAFSAGGDATSNPLTAKTLSEVSALIHSKTFTSKQLVQDMLDRIYAHCNVGATTMPMGCCGNTCPKALISPALVSTNSMPLPRD